MSFTETSKSNGAWFAIMSLSLISNRFVNTSIKSIILLLLTTTPFGTPVLPLVKLIYTGSISSLDLLMFSNSFSKILPLTKSSHLIIFISLKTSLAFS